MIKAMLFDIGGVLGDADLEQFFSFIESRGGDPKKGTKYFLENKWKADRGDITAKEYWENYCKHLGITATIDEIKANSPFRPYPGMIEILHELKEKGYDLYIGSDIERDSNSGVWKVYDKKLFKKLFLSFQVKRLKKEPEFFHIFLKETGLNPEDVFYIDDSPEKIASGKSVGLISFQHTDAKALRKELVKRGML